MQQPRWTRDNTRMIKLWSDCSGRLRDQALRSGLHAFKDADEEESDSHNLDNELDGLSISSDSDDLYSAAGKSAGDGGGCRPGAGDGAGVMELAVHSAKGEYTRSSATQLMPGSESNHGKPREPSEIQVTEMRSDARVEDARLSASVNSSTARSTTVYRPPTEPQPRPDNTRMAFYTTGVHGIDTISKARDVHGSLVTMERPEIDLPVQAHPTRSAVSTAMAPTSAAPAASIMSSKLAPSPSHAPLPSERAPYDQGWDRRASGQERRHSQEKTDFRPRPGKPKVIETSYESSDNYSSGNLRSGRDPRIPNKRPDWGFADGSQPYIDQPQFYPPVEQRRVGPYPDVRVSNVPQPYYGRPPHGADPWRMPHDRRPPRGYEQEQIQYRHYPPQVSAGMPYDMPLYQPLPAEPLYREEMLMADSRHARLAPHSTRASYGVQMGYVDMPAVPIQTSYGTGIPPTSQPTYMPHPGHPQPSTSQAYLYRELYGRPQGQVYTNVPQSSPRLHYNPHVDSQLQRTRPTSSDYSMEPHQYGQQVTMPSERHMVGRPVTAPYSSLTYDREAEGLYPAYQHNVYQQHFPASQHHAREPERYREIQLAETHPTSSRQLAVASQSGHSVQPVYKNPLHLPAGVPSLAAGHQNQPPEVVSANVLAGSSEWRVSAHGNDQRPIVSPSLVNAEHSLLPSAHGHVEPTYTHPARNIIKSGIAGISSSNNSPSPSSASTPTQAARGISSTAWPGDTSSHSGNSQYLVGDQLDVLAGVRPMPPIIQDLQTLECSSSSSMDLYEPARHWEAATVAPSCRATGDDGKGEEKIPCLVAAAHCKVDLCKYEQCKKGKCMFSDLTKLEREVGPVVPLLESGSAADQERSAIERWKNNNRLLLEAIWTHAAACPELLCSVPFCLVFNEIEDKEFECLLAELKVRYFTGIHIFSSEANEQYHALMEQYAKSQPLENVDWEGMSRMGHFSDTFLARQPRLIDGPLVELWTITKVYLHNSAEYRANLEGILGKLKGNPCKHIIPHLWYVAQETHLYICTLYEGESEDHHRVCDGNNAVSDVVRWYNQLQETADFLHERNILYLNWKTSAVLVRKYCHKDNPLVKLLNFTCAVDLDVDLEEHLENIHMFLHPLILPPEVQEQPHLQRATDYWGLGCLVYELLTGHKVHHNLRHWAPEEIRAHLSRDPGVDLSEISNPEMRSLLQQCFQVNPLQRNPPHKLQEQPDQVPQSETSPHRDIHMSGKKYEAFDWDDSSSTGDLQISDDGD